MAHNNGLAAGMPAPTDAPRSSRAPEPLFDDDVICYLVNCRFFYSPFPQT